MTDLCWQGFVRLLRLHALVNFVVGEVLAFVNECLPVLIVGSIVQVFRLERRFVNHAVARVILTDTMLLNELHVVHLLLAVLAVAPGRSNPEQSSQSCALPDVACKASLSR